LIKGTLSRGQQRFPFSAFCTSSIKNKTDSEDALALEPWLGTERAKDASWLVAVML